MSSASLQGRDPTCLATDEGRRSLDNTTDVASSVRVGTSGPEGSLDVNLTV